MFLASSDNRQTLITALGNPGDHAPSAAWESANLVMWVPPYPMFFSDKAKTRLPRLRVHRLALPFFQAAFGAALDMLGHDYIVAHRLDITGGTTFWRLERGGHLLSVHAWGIAIDMDPGHNPFPSHWKGPPGIDARFAEIMQAKGFFWRGRPGDIDPMHFQLAPRAR